MHADVANHSHSNLIDWYDDECWVCRINRLETGTHQRWRTLPVRKVKPSSTHYYQGYICRPWQLGDLRRVEQELLIGIGGLSGADWPV